MSNEPPKRTPDGWAEREKAHDRHQRACKRHVRVAQHRVINTLLETGVFRADGIDNIGPAPSGNRTYIGSAINALRAAKIIRADGPPTAVYTNGRHGPYLHTWGLAVDHAAALAHLAENPIPPEPEPAPEPGPDVA